MFEPDLFSSEEGIAAQRIPLKDADVIYYPNFLSSAAASEAFEKILNETPWQQDDIKVFGKVYKQPRLTALYGEEGKTYTYSGIEMYPKPFTPFLQGIKEKIEAVSETRFTTVLLNLYRDGTDSNGWHSDDEKELGDKPVIASLSLGVKRKFKMKHKKEPRLKHDIILEHGSLLLMKGKTQECWLHQIPKSKVITQPRINLTFRVIV
ncbi:MAG: alpha-ketoglutarate-dependent dioxygenase AlkB [Rhodobacter sp.]|nr:alpha-ketoglutarate-dependent dioxygenase AlkB [Rhodobacter sp.]